MKRIRPRLEAFSGRWQVRREIEDARAGTAARFEGEAVLTPDDAGLVYEESGTLILPGQVPMAATRRYLWQAVGADIALFFEDGRPFHVIAPEAQPEDHHDCPPDSYDVRYDFRSWPVWVARWRVTGPRKDYVSVTEYRRVS